MNELVSIIIPVFNHAHALERSFKTIFSQTYRPFHIIIVDDGSTDNFNQVITKLSQSTWFKPLDTKTIHQANKGAAMARNRGFKESAGDYVIFWDADTIAEPEMLEKMSQALKEHSEASYAYSQFRFGWKKFKCQPFNAEDLKKNNYVDTTSLIRREALKNIPEPFDESLKRFQDWDLWLTLLEHNKTGTFVPEVLYRKIVSGRKGMSAWLPRFVYRLPWRSYQVNEYEAAQKIILRKHHLV